MNWLVRLIAASIFAKIWKRPEPPLDGPFADAALSFLRDRINPLEFATAERQIRDEFSMHSYYSIELGDLPLKATRASLRRRPELASVLLFHGNGRIREAALESMKGPLQLPIVFYGLVSRLNDWSPRVRSTARNAFARCFSETTPEVLLPAVWILLLNSKRWRRWEAEREFIFSVLNRHDLVTELVRKVANEERGGSSQLLRILCGSPHIDPLVPYLATQARKPHVRAIAVRSMAMGKVCFDDGTVERQWIDKSQGRFRLAPKLAERLIGGYDTVALLSAALVDKSVIVRKEALDALIRLRADPQIRSLAERFLVEHPIGNAPSIQLRADYLRRALTESVR